MRLHTIIVPDEFGDWEFGLILVDEGSLYIDDKLLMDNSTDQLDGDLFFGNGTREEKGTIRLEKDKEYHLHIDFNNHNLVFFTIVFTIVRGFQIGRLEEASAIGKLVQDAVDLAARSEAVILTAGLTSDYAEEGFDRAQMRLPPGVDDMISRVLKANSNSNVVVKSGVQREMPWIDQATSGIQAFFGGNDQGNGLASVLFGEHNPSSKLPLTFPEQLEDFPSHPFFPGKKGISFYNEDVFVGYRHFVTRPTLPVIGSFGFGLSYTTFQLGEASKPIVDISTTEQTINVAIEIPVTNTGKVAAGEVVQCYIAAPSCPVPRPAYELGGFSKVYLQPGETKMAKISLDRGAFSYWETQLGGEGRWSVVDGEYKLLFGTSSTDLPVSSIVEVESGFTWRGIE
ncbi:uncharacterized protein L201_001430 [Kwoniella dendrophila CBS 6074]|uniref:beta-glucosidase n=1 Tax=Kwoniella dendrophila CBS 6074 TaxID=1295534 RepID=A0AAX4JNU5_9TREE